MSLIIEGRKIEMHDIGTSKGHILATFKNDLKAVFLSIDQRGISYTDQNIRAECHK